MKKIITTIFISFFLLLTSYFSFAGNEDRVGQAGAYELLINPWARSTGWGSVNTASVHGMEALFSNVAGTAFTNKTEVLFAHTIYLKGSEININAFGISQKVGQTGVLSLALMAMNFGDIPITTTDNPNDTKTGLGTFSPKFMNINISYAKAFSNSIYGGVNFKIINEAIPDISATGLAIDAGIQYVTGIGDKEDNIKFGISLKNIGTRLKYSGGGLTFRTTIPGASSESTVLQQSQDFELPSSVNIGAAYDIQLPTNHSLTAALNFTSNAFSKDQYTAGLEYGFKKVIYLRAGFVFEQGLFSTYNGNDPKTSRTTPYTGPCAGFSVDIPLNKEKGTKFSFDYSYRSTDPFQGTHALGVRISL
jgi:hypothetical protein